MVVVCHAVEGLHVFRGRSGFGVLAFASGLLALVRPWILGSWVSVSWC
jgi:hypothetical protein